MMPEQQQRILGYFIEEAKDHLNTIEQGLLNLQATIQDPEMVNEVFRAAHSVKGGAAMLSLGSIQLASHRLEDYFKVLKEAPTTQVDRELESMFLQVFDGLQALLEELQGPFGLTEDKAQEVMADIEPVFDQLENHLNTLVAKAPQVAVAPKAAAASVSPLQSSPTVRSEDSALKLVFSSDVPGHLREMLTLFKQADTETSRAALQSCCQALGRIGEQFELNLWNDLASAAYQAVGNPEQTYRALAPVVIKELKRAQEQVLSGQAGAISISAELEAFIPLTEAAEDALGDIDSLLDDALSTSEEPDLADLFETDAQAATGAEGDLDWLDLSTPAAEESTTATTDDFADSLDILSSGSIDGFADEATPREPTVGAAELNSLADLFEGEVLGLDSPWEEMSEHEASSANINGSDIDISDDFSDLLEGSSVTEETTETDRDLADLFGDTAAFEDDFSATTQSPEVVSEQTGEAEETDDFDDLFNITDAHEENVASLLDAAAATDHDLDDLLNSVSDETDAIASESLDLDFDTAPLETDGTNSADFEASWQTTATDFPFGNADLSEAEPAISEAAQDGEPGFQAIADPWSAEDFEEADESALDALDELWSEALVDSSSEEQSSSDDESGSEDFTDLNTELRASEETSDTDFADFLEADADAEADLSELFGAEGSEADNFADLLEVGDETPTESTAALSEEFNALDLETSDGSELEFDGLFDEPSAADDADTEFGSLFAAEETTAEVDDDFNFDELTVETAEPNPLAVSEPAEEVTFIQPEDSFEEGQEPDAVTATDNVEGDFDAFLGASEGATEEDIFGDDAEALDLAFTASDNEALALDATDGEFDSLLDEAVSLETEVGSAEVDELDLAEAVISFGEDPPGDEFDSLLDETVASEAETDNAEAAESGLEGAINLGEAEEVSSVDSFFDTNSSAEEANPAELDFDIESELMSVEEVGDSSQAAFSSHDDIDDFFETPSPLSTTSDTEEAEALFGDSDGESGLDEVPLDDGLLEVTGDTPLAEDFEERELSLDEVALDDELLEATNDTFSSEERESSLDEAASDEVWIETVDNTLLSEEAEEVSFDALVTDDSDDDTEELFSFDTAHSEEASDAVSFDGEFPDFSAATSTEEITEEEITKDSLFGEDSSPDEFDFGDLLEDDEAIAAEDNEATSDGPSEDEALDDLDALLEDAFHDSATEAGDLNGFGSDDAGFGELDSLLSDDVALNVAEPETSAADSNVDFGELDALLGDEIDPGGANEDRESGPVDEFSDLEKLLEEADQTLGGSSPIRSTSSGRSSRRVGGIVDQTMRVSVKHLDNLNNLVGELVVNRNSLEQDQDRLRQFLDNLLFQVQQLNDVGQRMRDLYERSLLESSLLASRQAFQSGGLTRSSDHGNGGSHATGATFDALEMDRFTGFHTLTQEMVELIVRVRESASDIAYTVESTDQIARQFRQVTTQLQEGLNKARMVPFAQTADRLPRAVRDISIKCGKEARLVVEGRDTLIDKMILERLYDPMTHLVNNAITHGVESPEERAAVGKSREGTITVRAFYQGNQTVIYIADDGGGINPDIVKRKAIQKGIITQAEADSMSTLETYELLFRHGFSTRDKADDFAGRGVGMDVVRTALSEIRGSITIDSELGKGTSFTIRLPLTLSISKALSCLNNQARIAFPMDGVEDMFDVPKERIQVDENNQTSIQWRDTLLTFQPLSELLQFNRALGRGRVYGGSQDEDMVSIVVLRNANTYIGIQVDRVLGEQEIVIKQIEGPVPKPMGIAGATVLGDGRVMPIGDVLELIDIAQGRVRREAGSSLWSQVELPPEEDVVATKTEPTVLIVDDSITVRELLSMSFNKVGYRVEQARDGQEAWEKMRSGLPCDLVFCDIEMPRMDGLELLSRMQKDSVLRQVPIAMLTSRGADRHRQMAIDLGASGYFTKPYLEEALLDAAQRMLNGEVLLNKVEEEAEE